MKWPQLLLKELVIVAKQCYLLTSKGSGHDSSFAQRVCYWPLADIFDS